MWIMVKPPLQYQPGITGPHPESPEEGMVNDMIRRDRAQRLAGNRAGQTADREKIWPSDANFLLVQVTDARAIYKYPLIKAWWCATGSVTLRRLPASQLVRKQRIKPSYWHICSYLA